jgi:hypothetical protein
LTKGACKPGERKRSSSKPLALAQFMSAFVLLGCGVCLAVVFLILEHLYFWYLRRWLAAICPQGSSVWCNLLSLSVGESLKQQQQQQQHRQHQHLQAPVCVVQSPPSEKNRFQTYLFKILISRKHFVLYLSIYLKVHKNENFFGSDFEF